jgi:hypothetical protein
MVIGLSSLCDFKSIHKENPIILAKNTIIQGEKSPIKKFNIIYPH